MLFDGKLEFICGGVTAAAGFQAGTAMAGIKHKGKRDVAVLYSTVPATAVGVFTANRVKAAPVLLSMRHLAGGKARAVVVNSGNANACNGEQGLRDALAMAMEAAGILGVPGNQVVVASTGVIGRKMPMDRVLAGIRGAAASLSGDGGQMAAEAIMTTDTVPKEAAVRFELGGKTVSLGGMAKGSGMIHPDMATLLCFITTDAAVAPEALRTALKYAVDRSFNMVSVDRDTSTNDMAVLLANGLAGNREIDGTGDDFIVFCGALADVCEELAVAVARDGEGASKLLTVEVINAASERDARLAARAVAGSNLVKAAVFGRDANWGRVICAAGYSGAEFDPEKVDIFLGGEPVARDGCSLGFDEEKALEILSSDTVRVVLDFKTGSSEATAWGCDLSYDYVRINGDYRT